MAYAAVASLSHTIDLVLNYHQESISPQFKDQIISLHKHTIFFESVLEDFPQRVKYWEETIREVSDRAEDIIELLLSDALLESKSTAGSSRSKLVKGKYEVYYGLDELERATVEMESIVNRVKGIHTEAMGGSDDELMKIISRLRGGSSALEIIPIVGIGGTGKTTLARNAYNHPLIEEHFDVRAWSTISKYYDKLRTVLGLLRCMDNLGGDARMSYSMDELISRVYKILRGNKYLIVLDDVWSFEILKRLKIMFPDDGNGSRIILTTRLYNMLVGYISTSHIHRMGWLDEDQTWNLFREEIFKGDPCPSQLEYVGKEIARKCKGYPLSIELVSGILAADQTECAWEDISENIKIASEDDEFVPHILSLSYTYLPHHLRPCFLYLGTFPEDHEIHVSKLIKLWVAEGFLNESEYKSFEEIGEEHVEDLVQRYLVSVSKWKSNGRIKSIKVHDLVRDFCLRQAQTDNFIHPVKRFPFPRDRGLQLCGRVRSITYIHPTRMDRVLQLLQSGCRVSDITYDDDDFVEYVYGSTIRTIMVNHSSALGFQFSIGNVKLLRILDSSNAYLYDLPDGVFELFHLRYLAFNCGFSISEAISNLVNLQTLIICSREKEFEKFGKLPDGIWRMPQLRHLIVFHFKLPSPKGVTSPLENLQTLSGVIDFICSRENLKMIPNLKKLGLLYTENSRDEVEDYGLHNLIYLQNLETLKIEINGSFKKEMSCAFPPTLRKLNLCGVQLAWKYMKIVASLPNLQVLKLRNRACMGKTWETSEGGFFQLTFLLIEGSNLKNWITESSHFPRLECLVLRCCLHLLEVPNEIGKIPTLEFIKLDKQNQSLLQSTYRIQEDRQSLGYDPLHILAP